MVLEEGEKYDSGRRVSLMCFLLLPLPGVQPVGMKTNSSPESGLAGWLSAPTAAFAAYEYGPHVWGSWYSVSFALGEEVKCEVWSEK